MTKYSNPVGLDESGGCCSCAPYFFILLPSSFEYSTWPKCILSFVSKFTFHFKITMFNVKIITYFQSFTSNSCSLLGSCILSCMMQKQVLKWRGAIPAQIASKLRSQVGFAQATLGTMGFVWARASPVDSRPGPSRLCPNRLKRAVCACSAGHRTSPVTSPVNFF